MSHITAKSACLLRLAVGTDLWHGGPEGGPGTSESEKGYHWGSRVLPLKPPRRTGGMSSSRTGIISIRFTSRNPGSAKATGRSRRLVKTWMIDATGCQDTSGQTDCMIIPSFPKFKRGTPRIFSGYFTSWHTVIEFRQHITEWLSWLLNETNQTSQPTWEEKWGKYYNPRKFQHLYVYPSPRAPSSMAGVPNATLPSYPRFKTTLIRSFPGEEDNISYILHLQSLSFVKDHRIGNER